MRVKFGHYCIRGSTFCPFLTKFLDVSMNRSNFWPFLYRVVKILTILYEGVKTKKMLHGGQKMPFSEYEGLENAIFCI